VQVARSGTVRTFFIPSGDHAEGGLVKGPDGNVWFTEIAHLGKIAMNGAITEFAYPSGGTSRSNFNAGITVGSDARVWFTEDDVGIVANVDPATDAITEYQAMSPSGLCGADGIAGGTDGALYFACRTASNAYVGKTGATQTISVSENGTSSWSAKTTNAGVASVVLGSMSNEFKVTAVGAGRCKIVVSDGPGNLFDV
jgi:streptogramin lyase